MARCTATYPTTTDDGTSPSRRRHDLDNTPAVPMRATITAELPDHALAELREMGYEPYVTGWGVTRQTLDADALVDALAGASLLICELEEVGDEIFARCPQLQVVASCRGNPVNVDLDAAARHGVLVLNTPGRNADSVADFTVAAILALQRGMVTGERHLREKGWNVDGDLPYFHFRGHELSRLTVGLLGYGAIGRKVARRLHDGFGATILVHDPYVDPGDLPHRMASLADLFAGSDVVSLHAGVSAGAPPLVGAAELALLGPGGYLVNTARAALVDEAALIDALTARRIAGAALDVFWTEPLPRDHPLLTLGNVLITPHLAGAAVYGAAHHARIVLEDLRSWNSGGEPLHAVVRPDRPRAADPLTSDRTTSTREAS